MSDLPHIPGEDNDVAGQCPGCDLPTPAPITKPIGPSRTVPASSPPVTRPTFFRRAAARNRLVLKRIYSLSIVTPYHHFTQDAIVPHGTRISTRTLA